MENAFHFFSFLCEFYFCELRLFTLLKELRVSACQKSGVGAYSEVFFFGSMNGSKRFVFKWSENQAKAICHR